MQVFEELGNHTVHSYKISGFPLLLSSLVPFTLYYVYFRSQGKKKKNIY